MGLDANAKPGAKDAGPIDPALLQQVAQRIVEASHAKTTTDAFGQYASAPIGSGGKVDDTCCVIGEVTEWTAAHNEAFEAMVRERQWNRVISCGGHCGRPRHNYDDPEAEDEGLVDDDSKDPLEKLLGCCIS